MTSVSLTRTIFLTPNQTRLWRTWHRHFLPWLFGRMRREDQRTWPCHQSGRDGHNQIGQTNRADIIGMLGRPSFEGAFDSRKIYYASQIMEQPVAGINKTKSRMIYAFTFDANNNLQKLI